MFEIEFSIGVTSSQISREKIKEKKKSIRKSTLWMVLKPIVYHVIRL